MYFVFPFYLVLKLKWLPGSLASRFSSSATNPIFFQPLLLFQCCYCSPLFFQSLKFPKESINFHSTFLKYFFIKVVITMHLASRFLSSVTHPIFFQPLLLFQCCHCSLICFQSLKFPMESINFHSIFLKYFFIEVMITMHHNQVLILKEQSIKHYKF